MKGSFAIVAAAMSVATLRADDNSKLNLMLSTASDNRPETYVTASDLIVSLAKIDGNGDGAIKNRFDSRELDINNCSQMHILAPAWWNKADRAEVQFDLFNVVPCHPDVAASVRDYPPGRVVSPDFDNGVWSVGTGLLGDTPVNMYNPPKGYEGDFARAALYVITLYGDTLWSDGNSWNFVTDSRWPGINAKALRQLIAWHDADPVDNAERARDAAIFAIQGNHNPFVVNQALVRDIFESDAHGGKVDPDDPQSPDDPVAPSQYPPLRPTYTMADGIIGLNSPYIPSNASYTVDGTPVTTGFVTTDSLGVGTHTIGFSTADFNGSVIINILP